MRRLHGRIRHSAFTSLRISLISSVCWKRGEGGIRTPDTLLEYGALAKRCFRPLSHLS